MADLISRQAAIELKSEFLNPNVNRETEEQTAIDRAYARGWNSCNTHWIDGISKLPSAQPEPHYDEWCDDCKEYDKERHCCPRWNRVIRQTLKDAQPEQRYTEEELMVFKHGISLSLLSKRSSQHWQYDEDTATEIKFLERLYEKVSADMRGAE